MSKIVLKVENLSKQYRLGYVGTRSLKDDTKRWWSQLRGLEDPFLKVGETNNRSKKGKSDYVWALKDINFEVKQGEILGIIGKNGAGKSTLLKLLSKVTGPTTGKMKVNGRIASLLEVGTGFHPELTGKENIYLNGAILGMNKMEVKNKFDEIVDFAGVERYIDTPVKRYSSGMYVRLAFAVAAHLEPEILIVDEVLAVGDQEFQKKAIGKMKEVSSETGRTVLFVSHNMASVEKLCNDALLLVDGGIFIRDDARKVVELYLKDGFSKGKVITKVDRKIVIFKGVEINGVQKKFYTIKQASQLKIRINYSASSKIKNCSFAIGFNDCFNKRISTVWSKFSGNYFNVEKGLFSVEFLIDDLHLIPGTYFLHVYVGSMKVTEFEADNVVTINIQSEKKELDFILPSPEHHGSLFLKSTISLLRL